MGLMSFVHCNYEGGFVGVYCRNRNCTKWGSRKEKPTTKSTSVLLFKLLPYPALTNGFAYPDPTETCGPAGTRSFLLNHSWIASLVGRSASSCARELCVGKTATNQSALERKEGRKVDSLTRKVFAIPLPKLPFLGLPPPPATGG